MDADKTVPQLDVVQRLRDCVTYYGEDAVFMRGPFRFNLSTLSEAANEIERLRAMEQRALEVRGRDPIVSDAQDREIAAQYILTGDWE